MQAWTVRISVSKISDQKKERFSSVHQISDKEVGVYFVLAMSGSVTDS
jgi:hypothetical protein